MTEVTKDDITEIHKKLDSSITQQARSIAIQEGALAEIKEIKTTIHDPRTGIAPRVLKMETTGGIFKWLASTGFGIAILKWLADWKL